MAASFCTRTRQCAHVTSFQSYSDSIYTGVLQYNNTIPRINFTDFAITCSINSKMCDKFLY